MTSPIQSSEHWSTFLLFRRLAWKADYSATESSESVAVINAEKLQEQGTTKKQANANSGHVDSVGSNLFAPCQQFEAKLASLFGRFLSTSMLAAACECDLTFLQGAANILGMATERERQERSLKAALARQQVLLREITHRVKNSLAIVASMLNLQAADVDDPVLTRHLEDAARRVSAVAKAHERIHQGDGTDRLDLGIYIEQVCRDLNDAVPHCTIEIEAEHGIDILTDRAIPVALIANELITNAAKYAYRGNPGGHVRVRLARGDDGRIDLSIRDQGEGLPADFDPRSAAGLGMRIVRAFSQQLNAEIAVRRLDPGTEFVVSVPRDQTL